MRLTSCRTVPKARPEADESRTKAAALLLAGCNLDVRVPEEPCFLSRPIPVEVFLLKDGELQHACNIPLQVGKREGDSESTPFSQVPETEKVRHA